MGSVVAAAHTGNATANVFSSGTDAVVDSIVKSFTTAEHKTWPYDYWLPEAVIPDDSIDDTAALPFAAPVHDGYSGKRDGHNSTRVYFSPENQARFPVCRAVAEAFKDQRVLDCIKQVTGADVSGGALRIEYCQDIDGFWLEPHKDISVKLFTMVLYLLDDPDLADAGTDVYDDTEEHNRVATAPYKRNAGVVFIPGDKTWHGFHPRPIRGVRKSLIINYVKSDWRAVEELA